MTSGTRDLGQVRLANALALFDEFVQANVKSADAATLRGLEGRFAERLRIQPSYWSQIKSRSRQIGERLARQFELLCDKPVGWMDLAHGPASATSSSMPATATAPSRDDDFTHNVPQDDDERFIVGLVLTYYRRHPQRARARLLDLLGEVLAPTAAPHGAGKATAATSTRPAPEDGRDLWNRTQAAVAPLKRKR